MALTSSFTLVGGAKKLYEELEFKSELQAFNHSAAVPSENLEKQYRTILTLSELDAFIAILRQSDGFAIDTETTNQDPMRAGLVGISLAQSAVVVSNSPRRLRSFSEASLP